MSGVSTGILRHRVELQAPVITQDPVTGEQETVWASVAIVWAEIAPLSGREYLTAGAEQSEVQSRITIRYREGIAADMRVVYRNLYYNIFAVLSDPDSGREHLTLMVGNGVRFYEEGEPDADREGLELEVGGILALE